MPGPSSSLVPPGRPESSSVMILRPIRARAARVRQHGGALGAACASLEDTRSRLQSAEHGSFAMLRRMAAMLLRLILDIVVVVVIALFELDTLRRRAANALAGPPRH
jgi:hypothetical protein